MSCIHEYLESCRWLENVLILVLNNYSICHHSFSFSSYVAVTSAATAAVIVAVVAWEVPVTQTTISPRIDWRLFKVIYGIIQIAIIQ